jgi:neutral ceramidase
MLEPLIDLDRGRARFSVRPTPPPPLDRVDGLLAGAAEVDITPPPGMPKAGYSANARTGIGFRTRLRARAVHLRSGTASIAIVQCDLLGGSSVLQHLVADALAREPDVDVPLAGLLIGATHTHAGPGQFLGTDFYNRFASNKSGFDPAYTSFLITQITSAVASAVRGRRPAKAAIGSVDVWGLTRNRSLPPHVQNESVADKRTEPQRKFAAINPALHLLRVDGVDEAPISATVVFSVHGTGVSMAPTTSDG